MKLSPIDINRQKFTLRFKGYDREEVQNFLSAIAEQMEQLLRENTIQKKEIERLNNLLEEYREREEVLKNTLVSAQRASDQLRENAEKESKLLIKEAELKAIKVYETAQKQIQKLQADILQLRMRKKHMQESILAQIEALRQLISIQKEEEEKEAKLTFFK